MLVDDDGELLSSLLDLCSCPCLCLCPCLCPSIVLVRYIQLLMLLIALYDGVMLVQITWNTDDSIDHS